MNVFILTDGQLEEIKSSELWPLVLSIRNYELAAQSLLNLANCGNNFIKSADRDIYINAIKDLQINIKNANTACNDIKLVFKYLDCLDDKSFSNDLKKVRDENKIVDEIMSDIRNCNQSEDADALANAMGWRQKAKLKATENLDMLVEIANRGDKYENMVAIAAILDISEIEVAMRKHTRNNSKKAIHTILEL